MQKKIYDRTTLWTILMEYVVSALLFFPMGPKYFQGVIAPPVSPLSYGPACTVQRFIRYEVKGIVNDAGIGLSTR